VQPAMMRRGVCRWVDVDVLIGPLCVGLGKVEQKPMLGLRELQRLAGLKRPRAEGENRLKGGLFSSCLSTGGGVW
jgi:hypothetical protein